MSISNLHSLINSPWYIDQRYAQAHLPVLFNILNGTVQLEKEEQKPAFTVYNKEINEVSSTGNKGKYVAVFTIHQPILKYDQMCGPMGTQTMIRHLDVLKNDDSIVGVVLDIDSGGGQAYGTPIFYDYLIKYDKPIVTYTDGLMCSAAYYIGSAGKYIIANKRAEAIGSIGAYSTIFDINGYYEKEGLKVHEIYATKSTEKNKAYREVLKGNYDPYIKSELNPLVDTFIQDMKDSMQNLDESVFNGGTFNGPEALEKGLIDELGNLQDAINKVYDLADNNKSNRNLNTMSKERKNVQDVLGLEGPLASNNEGTYLNDEQLDSIETHLANQEQTITDKSTTISDLTSERDTANKGLSDQNETINSIAEANGIEVNEDVSVTLSNIENRLTELGKLDASHPSKAKIDTAPAKTENAGYDPEASHNKLAKSLNL